MGGGQKRGTCFSWEAFGQLLHLGCVSLASPEHCLGWRGPGVQSPRTWEALPSPLGTPSRGVWQSPWALRGLWCRTGITFSFWVLLCSSPALSSDCGLWEMLAQTLGRLSPVQAGPLALGILKLQDW